MGSSRLIADAGQSQKDYVHPILLFSSTRYSAEKDGRFGCAPSARQLSSSDLLAQFSHNHQCAKIGVSLVWRANERREGRLAVSFQQLNDEALAQACKRFGGS
jgi:hypothetical protein